MNNGRKWLGLALVLGLVGVAFAQYYDQVLQNVGTIFWTRAQAVRWVMTVNSSNQLDVLENVTLSTVTLRLDPTDGSILLRTRTSTQIKALAPSAQDELLVNSSIPTLCLSSGTGVGAWVVLGVSTVSLTTSAGQANFPCY